MRYLQKEQEELQTLKEMQKRFAAYTETKRQALANLCDMMACPHSQEKRHYDPGSYYDQASVTYNISCSLCGQYKHVSTETCGWYG